VDSPGAGIAYTVIDRLCAGDEADMLTVRRRHWTWWWAGFLTIERLRFFARFTYI